MSTTDDDQGIPLMRFEVRLEPGALSFTRRMLALEAAVTDYTAPYEDEGTIIERMDAYAARFPDECGYVGWGMEAHPEATGPVFESRYPAHRFAELVKSTIDRTTGARITVKALDFDDDEVEV